MSVISKIKKNKPSTKNKSNKITFTFGENSQLEFIISELENIYMGLSKSEILKLSLVEFLNTSIERFKNLPKYLSPISDSNLLSSINSGLGSVLESDKDIDNYFENL